MENSSKIIIGTRGSMLALWQANFIAGSLRKYTAKEIVLKKIKTQGDKILDSPLSKIGGKGLFVKEIEEALRRSEIDLAVHSMKDVPTEIPKGLMIGAVTKREDPRDAFISRKASSIQELPHGSTLGTSSLRRRAQLLHFRSDLKVTDVRGNLDTRLRKMDAGDFDALILSTAGIERMGWQEKITQKIPLDISLSAVGQGTIGIEIREDDQETKKLVSFVNHKPTMKCILAERALMKKLEGGCQVPIGALGVVEDGKLRLRGVVASLNGEKYFRKEIEGSSKRAQELGLKLAENLLGAGADEVLREIRQLASGQ